MRGRRGGGRTWIRVDSDGGPARPRLTGPTGASPARSGPGPGPARRAARGRPAGACLTGRVGLLGGGGAGHARAPSHGPPCRIHGRVGRHQSLPDNDLEWSSTMGAKQQQFWSLSILNGQCSLRVLLLLPDPSARGSPRGPLRAGGGGAPPSATEGGGRVVPKGRRARHGVGRPWRSIDHPGLSPGPAIRPSMPD